jgi:hypothetical protein
LPGSSLPAK